MRWDRSCRGTFLGTCRAVPAIVYLPYAVLRSETHVPSDQILHDLRRTAENGLNPGIGVGLGNPVLVHVAVAAVQLQAPVDDLLGELGAPPLGLGRVDGGQFAVDHRA